MPEEVNVGIKRDEANMEWMFLPPYLHACRNPSNISTQHHCNMCVQCVCCSATLLAFLVELLKSSVAMQEQMLGGKGFLVIGYLLEKVGKWPPRGRVYVFMFMYVLFLGE